MGWAREKFGRDKHRGRHQSDWRKRKKKENARPWKKKSITEYI
jgi:hypothetical protein